jgi:GT2 family glycosyltransferase
MAVRVLTIIITHNGESFIEECLNSVLNSAFNSDIFVIDNASQDSTIAILNNFGDKIYCKLLKTNIGFGRANNLGMKFAVDQNYDFVFLLNQDALVQKEAIGQLVYDAIKLDKCGIISPIHLDESGLHLDPNHLFHLQTISKLIHTECDFLTKKSNPVLSIDFTNAAAWLISRSFLEQVGGFDPLFFLYGEDVDLNNRRKFHKFKFYLSTSAFIHHLRKKSSISDIGIDFDQLKLNSKEISILKNININIFFCSSILLSKKCKSIFVNLYKFEFMEINSEFKSLYKVIKLFRLINEHRKLNKQKRSSFL